MLTPKAPMRTTPLTGPREAPRAPCKPRRPAVYSAAPLCTIDENVLPSSRFINTTSRRLAFRDSSGAVNLHMCQRSLDMCDGTLDTEPEIATLASWERHARRHIANRPAEEQVTLEEMLAEELGREQAQREAHEWEESHASLPISLRKPQRTANKASTPVAAEETIVVLPPAALAEEESAEDDDEERAMSAAHRLAPRTVSMQRRLFRAPQPGDKPGGDDHHDEEEPSADLLYRRRLEERAGQRARRSPTPSSGDDDVYEVGALLREEAGRFLVRWEGFGADEDTWEPEENIAPALVHAYRARGRRMASHVGDDYLEGRTRMLWCATCAEHRAADCFSSNQRKVLPRSRACLHHHYRIDGAAALPKTPPAAERHARQRAQKRSRADAADPPTPPPPPQRPTRPFAPSTTPLSARAADAQVARCRLYGFASW